MHYWRKTILKFKPSSKSRPVNYYATLSQASILHKLKYPKPLHQVHAQIIASNLSDNVFLCNRLMNAYASSGHIAEAQVIFSRITKKNIVFWTILVSGLTKSGLLHEAIDFFREMMVKQIRPNEVTIASVLPAVGKSGVALLGKSVHCYWMRHDLVVGSGVLIH